jgi:pimeloyl-ACP methyl ester carboxylesterase
MFDLLDLWLLRRGIPTDDSTLTFRRVDGNPRSSVIYFLPWHTPFRVARHIGLIRLDYLACYEMPPAIVSSRPELSVEALHRVAADAEALLAAQQVRGSAAILIGLSAGTYPATYLANRIGARLCAVAPSDRADRMIWESPATRLIKRRALMSGVNYWHYARAMRKRFPGHTWRCPGGSLILRCHAVGS